MCVYTHQAAKAVINRIEDVRGTMFLMSDHVGYNQQFLSIEAYNRSRSGAESVVDSSDKP